jgi:hypothetical protein
MIGTMKFTVISLLLAASVSQQKPNFAGTWVPVSSAKPGNELVIVQDDKQLTVDYFSGGKSVRRDVIIFDGGAHKRTVPMRGGEIVIDYKAIWQGNRLALTTGTVYPNGMKTAGTETWSIDAKGQLVIDTTEKGPGGPGPSGQMILARKK